MGIPISDCVLAFTSILIINMNYLQSLRINEPIKLAAVGAGGKSGFLFQLAKQLPGKKIISTTTHISIAQSHAGDIRLKGDDPCLLEKIISAKENAIIVIIGTKEERDRVNGPEESILASLSENHQLQDVSFLIEADGAKKMSLKAFGENEPVVPHWVDTIVHVIGWNTIGKQVNSNNVFRVDNYSALTSQQIGDTITFSSITDMLLHPQGGKNKYANKNQRIVAFINQYPENEVINQEIEKDIARLLTQYNSILFGNTNLPQNNIFAAYEKMAAVILAAGGSSRMGEQIKKQLLEIEGEAFINRAITLAINSRFAETIVVLGHSFNEIRQKIKEYPISILQNKAWANGQSTSVITAVEELLNVPDIGGAIFIPVDQPYLDTETISQIVRWHTRNIGHAIVPRYKEKPGAPVIFDRDLFKELLQLNGDKGGRSILHQVPHRYCDIDNPSALLDIDTTADYEQLLKRNH
jgi:molybdenum cofactor cytidylyltransferase